MYFKSYFRYNEQAAVIAAYLTANDIPFVCSELRDYMPLTKLAQFMRLALGGIPIAKTVYLSPRHFVSDYESVAQKLGVPFIFKSTDGSGGKENYLVRSQADVEAALHEYPDLHFVAQQFIENDSDLRVLIVDSAIELVIHRQRVGESHLNNTSQGGNATLMAVEDLVPEHQALALQSAKLMGREVAGVDLMFESGSGDPYVLEVNASPQIGSGAFMEEKLQIYSNYFKNMLK